VTYATEYELPYSVLGKLIDKLKAGKDLEKGFEKTVKNMKKALET